MHTEGSGIHSTTHHTECSFHFLSGISHHARPVPSPTTIATRTIPSIPVVFPDQHTPSLGVIPGEDRIHVTRPEKLHIDRNMGYSHSGLPHHTNQHVADKRSIEQTLRSGGLSSTIVKNSFTNVFNNAGLLLRKSLRTTCSIDPSSATFSHVTIPTFVTPPPLLW